MGAEAKRYLQEHSIPQLFEGLMTGLIYNKPPNPIDFLENALSRIRKNPDLALRWDSFVDSNYPPTQYQSTDTDEKPRKKSRTKKNSTSSDIVEEEPGGAAVQNERASKTGNRPKSRAASKSPAARLDQRRKTLVSSTGVQVTRRQSVGQSRLNVATGREPPPKSRSSSRKPKKEAKRAKSRQSTKSARTEKGENEESEVESDEQHSAEYRSSEESIEDAETEAGDLKSARSTKRD